MRVAHLITGLEVGGAEMMLFKLLGSMDRAVFEPMVISLVTPGPMGARIADLGVRLESLGMRRGLPDPLAVLRLVRMLRGFGPDLVQTWMYHADLVGGLAAPFVARGSRRPILVWNIRQSDLDPRNTRRGTRLIARLNAWLSHRVPDHIVCCSERARSIHLALGYRGQILSVIPNGFELDRFRSDPEGRTALRAQLGIPADVSVIGLAARFDPQKDLRTFLEAAALVSAAQPGCRLLLCGQGMDKDNPPLCAWIAEAGLAGVVHLLGPRADMPRVFAAMDLLVSSSAYGEGFPIVIGEAMACGVPCAVTDVGDSALIVGETGLTVPPRDPRALAGAVLRLLADGPEQRARRGHAARARIESDYSLSRVAARYADLYQSLRRSVS